VVRRVACHLPYNLEEDNDIEGKTSGREQRAKAEEASNRPEQQRGHNRPKKTKPNGKTAIHSKPSPIGLAFTWMKRNV
jgi:hypothetical protein